MTDNQSIELASTPSVERLVELDNDQLGEMLGQAAQMEAKSAAVQGAILAIAKERLAHGEWTEWLKRYWPKSVRTARLYMRLAGKTATVAVLPSGVKAADKALREPRASKKVASAPPAPVVDEFESDFVATFMRWYTRDEHRVRLWLRAMFQPPQPAPGLRSVRSEPEPPQVEPLPPIEHSTDWWAEHGRDAQPKKVRDAPVTRRRGSGL